MAQQKVMNKKSSFEFKWWMAVVLIAIIAVVGIVIRLFSHAGGYYNDTNRAYILDTTGIYGSLSVVQLKTYNYASPWLPGSSEYVKSNWLYFGTFPNAVSTLKANTVSRWVDPKTINKSGQIVSSSVCATIQKLNTAKNGSKSFGSVTEPPSKFAVGDNVEIIPTTNCQTPSPLPAG
ncbi:MAG: hypothetical protein WCH00_03195 [Candidatus Saccharibacteria bacterium]